MALERTEPGYQAAEYEYRDADLAQVGRLVAIAVKDTSDADGEISRRDQGADEAAAGIAPNLGAAYMDEIQ